MIIDDSPSVAPKTLFGFTLDVVVAIASLDLPSPNPKLSKISSSLEIAVLGFRLVAAAEEGFLSFSTLLLASIECEDDRLTFILPVGAASLSDFSDQDNEEIVVG